MRGLPEFEVTRTDSMQWNRTVNLDMLTEVDDPGTEVELPPELLEKVRALIADEVGRLSQEDLSSGSDPKADDPVEVRVQVNINPRSK